MANYNILLSTDSNYIFYMLVTCQSILNSLEDLPENSQDKIVFHVITDQTVSPKLAQSFVQEFTQFNSNSKVAFEFDVIDFKPDMLEEFQPMYRGHHLTYSNYYRIIFDNFISSTIDRLLYLDVDIMICADIRRLFNECPMGNEVLYAAATTAGFHISEGITTDNTIITLKSKTPELENIHLNARDYFNSGLLLYNLKQWREQNIEKACLNIGQNWLTILHDQDLLNAACAGKVSYVDPAWNLSFGLYAFVIFEQYPSLGKHRYAELKVHSSLPSNIDDLNKLILDPKGVHFTYDKPWISLTNPRELAKLEQIAPMRWKAHLEWHKIFSQISPIIRNISQTPEIRADFRKA